MLKKIKTKKGEKSFPFVLHKGFPNESGKIKGEVRLTKLGLAIRIDGYGDHASEPGYGEPIFLEHYNGKLRLIVWADINQEEPTHCIELEGAREKTLKVS